MKTRGNILITIGVISLALLNQIQGQDFKGFSAFTNRMEYEGQRFLMDNIFHVSESDFDYMKIDQLVKEIDGNEGFGFSLTSYNYNGNKGVVITSLFTEVNSYVYKFINIHLTHEEFTALSNEFIELKNKFPRNKEHYLKRYNDQLIIEISRTDASYDYILWIENNNRHTFSMAKWERAYDRYIKFVE